MVSFQTLDRAIHYFPLRLFLGGGFTAYVFFQVIPFVNSATIYPLSALLSLVNVNAAPVSGGLALGTSRAVIVLPILSRGVFYVFFVAYALVISAPMWVRIRAILFAVLTHVAFIFADFALICSLAGAGSLSGSAYLEASLLLDYLFGAIILTTFLYTTLLLPPRVSVKPIIKRSYWQENAIMLISLTFSMVIIFLYFQVLPIVGDSTGNGLASGAIFTALIPYNLLTYFGRQSRVPAWTEGDSIAKLPRISFLIPAYNEEGFIANCIRSIDEAAGEYKGVTDIVVVNDGSKDSTSARAHGAAEKCQNCPCLVVDQQNMGKGRALNNGLPHTKGDVVFRVDADSKVTKNAISLVSRRFADPLVGGLSGYLFPFDESSIWQKLFMIQGAEYIYYKIGDEVTDSIMIQPGAFSVFRKSCLVQLGGWAEGISGEDGDITLRVARLGYAHVVEEDAVVFSDAPGTLAELRKQRVRWNTATFHSRNRNLGMLKQNLGPRSNYSFPIEVLSKATGIIQFMLFSYMLAGSIAGVSVGFSALGFFGLFPINVLAVSLPFLIIPYIIYIWFLIRFRKSYLIKYLIFYQIYYDILLLFLIEVTGKLLPKQPPSQKR